jgi:dipeptidyl aminopeptidase/acylaminoacyl peptidase
MVAIFPMTDFAQWCQEAPRFLSKVCAANGLEKNDTKGLSEISPSSHIKAYKDTPIFLLHGTNDKLVPIGHSRGFAAALKAERCPVVLHEVPGLGHNDAVVRNYQNAIFNFFDKGINTTK